MSHRPVERTLSGMTDWELLQQYVQGGEAKAFEELMRRHLNMVYGSARRRIPHAAEDVTQAVFMLLVPILDEALEAVGPAERDAVLIHHSARQQPIGWKAFWICACMLLACSDSFAQNVTVNIRIIEEDKQRITPAMACITDVDASLVIVPPDGAPAGPPTFPGLFFEGIPYSSNANWVGPIRMTAGKGGVNQERTYVYGTNPSLPYWREAVMHQVSGDFSIDLKPGKYRISIQHGNEYIPITEEFSVDSRQAPLNKRYLLKRWINLPSKGWYSGDVHVHHPLNEARFKEYLLQFARAEDLHVANILEMGDRHNTYFKVPLFGSNSAVCREETCLAFGQEDPRSDYGHVIGLNIDALARNPSHYNYYDLVFNKIHESPSSLAGFAHFAYKGEGVTQGMALFAPLTRIDFVELMQNTQINQSDYYDYLNMGFRIAAAAGSDFPWGSTIGDCRTFVHTGAKFSSDAWFKGLKNGTTFVSNGPAIFLEVNGKMPGHEIACRKNEPIHIHATALSNAAIGVIREIRIYNNDGLVYSKQNPAKADSLTFEIDHAVAQSQWICAAVFCENIALAHSSPIYVIADGKPIFNKKQAPALIAKQVSLLNDILAKERAKENPDAGIRERVDKAKEYYMSLLKTDHKPE